MGGRAIAREIEMAMPEQSRNRVGRRQVRSLTYQRSTRRLPRTANLPRLGLALVLAGALFAAACAGSASEPSRAAADAENPSSSAGGAGDGAADGDWATYGYSLDNNRHVPFDRITKENVGDLGRAWTTDFQKIDPSIPGGQQAQPLVVDGVMYVTTSFNHVFAMEADTGDVLWHFTPSEIGTFHNFGVTANRGLAYCDGKLFMMAIDMRLISLDPATGDLVKQVKVEDTTPDLSEATTDFGYYQTSAPVCHEDTLIVGSSGADNGVRGFVMAYDTNLEPAWAHPYWTVPPEGQGWRSQGRFHGGGTSWVPATIDVDTDTVYFSTANPSPDFFPELRPGNNPKTNSIVAVDLHSGEEKWWAQQVAPDQWDYDTGTVPVLFTGIVDGEERRLVAVGSKAGWWYAYDAQSGGTVYEEVPFLNLIDHAPLEPGKPVTIAPSALGGQNYAPASYDPTTNSVFIAAAETKSVLIQEESARQVDKDRRRGDVDTGAVNGFGETPKGWHDYGSVNAIDIDSGELKWKFETPEPERGGVTTTDSGLGFVGGGDGVLRAFDTSTGAVLWQFQTGGQIAAPPAIYEVDGTQYVAIAMGGTGTSSNGGQLSRIDVFALGGDQMQSGGPENLPQVELATTRIAPDQMRDRAPAPGDGEILARTGDNTYTMELIAGAGSASGFNFNGYEDGEMTISVPEGAQVSVDFSVKGSIHHSVSITASDNRTELQNFPPAFDGAVVENPSTGIANSSTSFDFVADRQGRYALLCAVPGHAVQGMWIWFEVGPSGSDASVTQGGETEAVR
jgi:alcohol dehydrogenase (cytochrome c)